MRLHSILKVSVLFLVLVFAAPAQAARVHTAIMGGHPGVWTSSLVLITDQDATGSGWLCSGTVIAPNAILTAAHCATGIRSSYQVTTSDNQTYSVASIITHPGYANATEAFDIDDAAVLILSSSVKVPSIALAATEPDAGTSAIIAGYGITNSLPACACDANWAHTVVQSNESGLQFWGAAMWAPTNMSAINSPVADTSIAGGDSGGPLIVSQNGVATQAGINAESADTTTVPQVFVRVDMIRSWIMTQLAAAQIAALRHIPNVTGMRLYQARYLLHRAGFTLKARHGHGRNHHTAPRAIRESPAASAMRAPGAQITVWFTR